MTNWQAGVLSEKFINKAIIEGHGGTISATSAGKGQGSRFTIALPEKTSAA
jgi:signal transduction histidine kinase